MTPRTSGKTWPLPCEAWLGGWAAGLPALLALALCLWQLPWLIYPKILLMTLALLAWAWGGWSWQRRWQDRLRQAANVLEGLAQGDPTLRLHAGPGLAELATPIAALGRQLRQVQDQARAEQDLTRTVLQALDLAVLAFDEAGRLCLINPSAELLLKAPGAALLGRTAESLGLSGWMEGAQEVVCEHAFPGASGTWRIRRHRQALAAPGHTLLCISDLRQALREQELKAWHHLLRVLSHEVQNALAPIISLSGSLQPGAAAAARAEAPPSPTWSEDLREALPLIESRARQLSEFVRRYARWSRLPEPQWQLFDLLPLLQRLAALSGGVRLAWVDAAGEPCEAPASLPFHGDAGQIEQLLGNLLKNAHEAERAAGIAAPEVELVCACPPERLWLRDRGVGLANPANLFVPFYTTKPGGSGIGLVLSRQIAEGHGGSLWLSARQDGPGAEARLHFPGMARAAVKQ